MPRSTDQKLKILYLLKFLSENTDYDNPVSMNEILSYLASKGISAERKSIYSDVEALNFIGYDILNRKERPAGYYMGSRDFELAELKLLVDAVQSSKFITERKSNALIAKIEKLTNKYEAVKLQRQVYVTNRVKADNEAVLYSIDNIHEAIANNHKLSFQYGEWTLKKELVPKYEGKVYKVSPRMLVMDDGNYYLVAREDEVEKTKHFRVDKMLKTAIVNEMASDHESFDPAVYVREHFGMYSGTQNIVNIRFPNKLIGVVIDRFGKEVTTRTVDDEHFVARLKVQVSDQFFGWLAGFRGKAVIEGPEDVVEEYNAFIKDIKNAL